MMSLRHHPHPSSLIIGNRFLNLLNPYQPTPRNIILSLYSSLAQLSRVAPPDCGHGVPVSCWLNFSFRTQVRPVLVPVSSQHLPAHPASVVNKSVLELGSGTGFLGLILADIQVSSGGVTRQPALYLTDVNENVLRRCHENTQLPCSRLVACIVEAQLSYSRRISPSRKFICQIAGLG